MAEATVEEVDGQIRDIINSLYLIILTIHDYQGQESQKSVTTEMYETAQPCVQKNDCI